MRDAGKLEDLLAALPTHPVPDGWRDRVLATIDEPGSAGRGSAPVSERGVIDANAPAPAESGQLARDPAVDAAPARELPSSSRSWSLRWPHWLGAGGVLAAAAAVAIYVGVRPGPLPAPAVSPPELQIAFAEVSPGGSAQVGQQRGADAGVVRARGAKSLRVYADGALIARCPGDPGCTGGLDELSLSFQLPPDGVLKAVAYAGELPALPDDAAPSSGDLDRDMTAATRRQIRMKPLSFGP